MVLVFNLLNLFQEFDLLVLLVLVFLFGQVQLPDESVGLMPVFSDSLKVRLLRMLAFNLQLLVLVQQVSVLVLQLTDVSCSATKFLDLSLELADEEFLVLADSCVLLGWSWGHWGVTLSLHRLVQHLSVWRHGPSCLVPSIMVLNSVTGLELVGSRVDSVVGRL